jgi:hypothetical protein
VLVTRDGHPAIPDDDVPGDPVSDDREAADGARRHGGDGGGTGDVTPRGDRRASGLRGSLAAHAVALALVLLAGFVVLRPGAPGISDEGVALAQADALAGGRGWLFDHPLPAVDPDGAWFPLHLSLRDGDSLRFAPLAKHPLFASVLAPLVRVAGPSGAFLLPLAGTVAAAVAAALLARRLRLGDPRVALWITGIGSPLLFDAYFLIAHSLGAALAAAATVLLLRRRPLPVAAGLAALAGAQLLRNEAVLFGGALLVAFLIGAWRGRRRLDAALAAAVGATTLATFRLDAQLTALVADPGEVRTFAIARKGSFLEERTIGVYNALFRPVDTSPALTLLTLGVLALLVLVAREPGRSARSRLAAAAAVLATAAFVAEPAARVPGFLVAAPVLVCGVVAFDRRLLAQRDRATADAWIVVTTLAVFVLAVLATQYPDAGSVWGGRFLALGIPLVAPFAAAGLGRLHLAEPEHRRRELVAAFAVAVLASGAMAVGHLRTNARYTAAMTSVVAEVTEAVPAGDGDPRPVVVTTAPAFGRLLWPLATEQRWLLTPGDELADAGPALRRAGIEQLVVLTGDAAAAEQALAPWYRFEPTRYRAAVDVSPRGRTVLPPVVLVLRAR